jgi:hypothetical protein
MGKLLISHRSTIYPCYIPVLGEFNRSWSYKTYPLQKYNFFLPKKQAVYFSSFLTKFLTFALYKPYKTIILWKQNHALYLLIL